MLPSWINWDQCVYNVATMVNTQAPDDLTDGKKEYGYGNPSMVLAALCALPQLHRPLLQQYLYWSRLPKPQENLRLVPNDGQNQAYHRRLSRSHPYMKRYPYLRSPSRPILLFLSIQISWAKRP